MLSCSLALLPQCCITNVSRILLRTNQPGKEDRKDSHHKLSALLSLIFGRSSSWCSMTNKATASSILLECPRMKKCHVNHAFMLSCSLAPMLYHKRIKHAAAYKSAGKRRQKRFFITSCQLCWAWCLEDHPLDAAWQIRQLLLAHN